MRKQSGNVPILQVISSDIVLAEFQPGELHRHPVPAGPQERRCARGTSEGLLLVNAPSGCIKDDVLQFNQGLDSMAGP